jgi:hypothetical protein
VSFEWSLASVPKHIEGLRYASDSLAPYVVLGVDLLLAVLLCVTVGLFVARKLARRP